MRFHSVAIRLTPRTHFPSRRFSTFCGIARGASHLGTAAYNAKWGEYMQKMSAWTAANGIADKAYWYMQNEPQTVADDDLAAFLCKKLSI